MGRLTIDSTLVAQAPNFGFDVWNGDDLLDDMIESVDLVDEETIRVTLTRPAEVASVSPMPREGRATL